MIIIPIFTFLLCLYLGTILTQSLNLKIPRFALLFYILSLGIISLTIISYLASLIFTFPLGVLIAQVLILIFILTYLLKVKKFILLTNLHYLIKEKPLLTVELVIMIILIALFNTHILMNINGDLYTGESTYGDLPFHLSIISQLAYGQKFPPQEPFYTGIPLAYPFLVNFFSSILVLEGLSLRDSIIIPGLILSFALIGLVYEFSLYITKDRLKTSLATIFYFFNGSLGYYFFLQDNNFSLSRVITSLTQPTTLKEYSHLFSENIQWGNFLSRMVVPERSLLFGLPAGLILLRIIFFREDEKLNYWEILIAGLLLAFMPLLHTHTVLVFGFIFPVLVIYRLRRHNLISLLKQYGLLILATAILAIPQIPIFLNHLNSSQGFMHYHFGWMVKPDENLIWFWFKNTYLFVIFSLLSLLFWKVSSKETRFLQVAGLLLLVIINFILFSPYDWDNVKFLFWGGLFFSIAAGSILGYLLKKNYLLKTLAVVVSLTMILSACLSIWREVNLRYVLFDKEAVSVGESLRDQTPQNSIFLTYKVHNSPVSNIAGRQILMGYPGLLWTQGIDYGAREQQVNQIFEGQPKALQLLHQEKVNYVVIGPGTNPEGFFINQDFFNQFPLVLKTPNFSVYQIPSH